MTAWRSVVTHWFIWALLHAGVSSNLHMDYAEGLSAWLLRDFSTGAVPRRRTPLPRDAAPAPLTSSLSPPLWAHLCPSLLFSASSLLSSTRTKRSVMASSNHVTPTNCSWWPISATDEDGKVADGEESEEVPAEPKPFNKDRLVLYHWTQSFASQKVKTAHTTEHEREHGSLSVLLSAFVAWPTRVCIRSLQNTQNPAAEGERAAAAKSWISASDHPIAASIHTVFGSSCSCNLCAPTHDVLNNSFQQCWKQKQRPSLLHTPATSHCSCSFFLWIWPEIRRFCCRKCENTWLNNRKPKTAFSWLSTSTEASVWEICSAVTPLRAPPSSWVGT